jgi:hypothetical protein
MTALSAHKKNVSSNRSDTVSFRLDETGDIGEGNRSNSGVTHGHFADNKASNSCAFLISSVQDRVVSFPLASF